MCNVHSSKKTFGAVLRLFWHFKYLPLLIGKHRLPGYWEVRKILKDFVEDYTGDVSLLTWSRHS